PPHAALLSFHDKKRRLRQSSGIHMAPARDADRCGFWGLQAVVFPKCTLEYLVTKDPYSVWTFNKARHGDRVVEEFVLASSCPRIAYHVPSLVRHVGVVSAAYKERTRPGRHVPETYVGDDFDAMSLPWDRWGARHAPTRAGKDSSSQARRP